MSYLGSIIARTAGSVPLLRPRRPSRFEQSIDSAPPMEITVERETAPPARVVAAPASPSPPTFAEPRESAAREPAPPALQPLVVSEKPLQVAAPAPAPPARREERRSQVKPIETPRVQATAVAREIIIERLERESERAQQPGVVTLQRHERPSDKDDAPLRALLLPRAATPRDESHAGTRGTAAPAIRVTIGRVDVRAIPAPPPRREQAPRGASFTIDDYIRLRNRGR